MASATFLSPRAKTPSSTVTYASCQLYLRLFLVMLLLHCVIYNSCASQVILRRIHSCPLEWCTWLWNKERCTHGNLTFSISSFLWDLIISLCHALCKLWYALHILFCLSWQSKHKIQLYMTPAALKSFSCTLKNYLLSQALVYYITKTLCTCLWCKCKTAFLTSCTLLNNIK